MSVCVNHVQFSYDQRPVLSDVSLQAQSGELVAVVGPSGSGKSTLLRLIAGLLPKKHSKQRFAGTIGLPETSSRRASDVPGGLGLMFQEPVLLPNRTVEQNIRLPFEMLSLKGPSTEERIEESLRQVGLAEFRELRPAHLSVGMKARVSLAMTISTRPSVLLLDEPFSSLDIAWRLSLYRTVNALRKANCLTTVLVTHDLREAVLLADVIIVLDACGCTGEPIRVSHQKPQNFTPKELAEFNVQSIATYTKLEAMLVSASAEISHTSSKEAT